MKGMVNVFGSGAKPERTPLYRTSGIANALLRRALTSWTLVRQGLLNAAVDLLFYTAPMKFLLSLLLAFALSVNAFAAVSAQSRLCCESNECTAVQCADMGCLPAVSPLAAPGPVALAIPAGNSRVSVEPSSYLADRYKEIWTPPD